MELEWWEQASVGLVEATVGVGVVGASVGWMSGATVGWEQRIIPEKNQKNQKKQKRAKKKVPKEKILDVQAFTRMLPWIIQKKEYQKELPYLMEEQSFIKKTD